MIPNHIQKNKFVIQLILEMIGCIAGLYNSPLSLLQNDFFFLFTPCKTEQPLQGMELQEKQAQKDYRDRKVS